MISKVIIQGFKCINSIRFDLKQGLNILVGDNETGKTTILEAINLVISGQLNGKSIFNDLSPYLFNFENVNDFIMELKTSKPFHTPQILIEVYFIEDENTIKLKGINNTEKEDSPGLSMLIALDKSYAEEFMRYISKPEKISTIPTEYYSIQWQAFSGNPITNRTPLIRSTYIDASSLKLLSGADRFINKNISESLSTTDRANLALEYRMLKRSFSDLPEILEINKRIEEKSRDITSKSFSISIDDSVRNSWDNSLISYVDNIPFQYIGMGEQSCLKIGFALNSAIDSSSVFLVEEPENHLSYSNMNKLIERIAKQCVDKQLIISTHSTFVLNKLGIENLMLYANGEIIRIRDLSPETVNYFKKLPGYNTLRMILANRVILVEGPSEELLVQRCYFDIHGKLPINDGIDIVTINGLSFKRFLEIAKKLSLNVTVITDNDGDNTKVEDKYKDYFDCKTVKIKFDRRESLNTMEKIFGEENELKLLNDVLGKEYESKNDLVEYMLSNKTDWALSVFESPQKITFPKYIKDELF